jgi:3-phenylpropionate/trans-cinnamate dioxygenase ferredoxin subunit
VAEFVAVAKTSDVAPGNVRYVEVKGHRIALCNADGEFYAISDVCTHDNGPLDQGELDGYHIECPRHGARFDVRTGSVITLPAVLPIDTYPVRVVGDEVQVEV